MDFINTDQYPVDNLNSLDGQKFLKLCRNALRQTGICQLHRFVKPQTVDELILGALNLLPSSFATDSKHNVYFTPIDETLASDDPHRMMQHSAKKAIATDQINISSPLKQLYEWDAFMNFLAKVLEKKKLYRSADPFDACVFAVFEPSDELGWHFDNSEFAVTLMLQPAESGGVFQYVPKLRKVEDPNFPAVQRLLEGDENNILTAYQYPGTLCLFAGRYSIHRVTPVQGNSLRINAVLNYGEQPNLRLSKLTQKLFYGRVDCEEHHRH